MPAGNLTVVDNVTGTVISTGCKTIKMAENVILEHLTELAGVEESDTVERSYSVFSPYKKFGDSGVKGFSVSKEELLNAQKEETEEDNSEVEEETESTDEEDLDFV